MSNAQDTDVTEKLNKLTHVNQTIAGCLEQSEVLKRCLELEKELVDAETGSILLLDESGDYLNFAVALGEAESTLKDYRLEVGEGVAGYVAEHREPVLIPDTDKDQRFTEYFDEQTGYDTETVLCVPIQLEDRLLGVAEVINKTDGSAFTEEDLLLFSAFAGQIAVSLENARLHQDRLNREQFKQEVELCRKVQASYLPDRFPSTDQLEFGARLQPAKQVSGDFYDGFELPDGRVALLIGDVSGKGMAAAMYMCRVMTELRSHLQHELSPEEAMNRVNERLVEKSTRGMFVTLLLFVIDPDQQNVEVANAGHLPFYRRDGDRFDSVQEDDNPPMGITTEHDYQTYSIELGADSIIKASTDGVIDVCNEDGERFGSERLEKTLRETILPPDLLVRKIFRDVEGFCDDTEQADDMTMVSFGTGGSRDEFHFEIMSRPSYLDLVRDAVEHLLEPEDIDNNVVNEIKVGLNEALCNIIEHTYHNRKNGPIRVNLSLKDDRFIGVLEDEGEPVKAEDLDRKEPDDETPGGLGLSFMDNLFDRCEYDPSVDEGNRLILERTL